jgi:hypothetical protein
VKPEIFDSILANLSFLLGNLISCLPQKEEKEGEFLIYNPPELVQPTEDHLSTGGVCSHAGQLRKPLGWTPGQSQR